MSRIGKLPITIPSGVTLEVNDKTVTVKGPRAELSLIVTPAITLSIANDTISLTRKNDSLEARSLHGLTRQLIANMITGVATGFEKRLELKGVGYRASTESDKRLILNVGYSHPVPIQAPGDIIFKVEKNVIIVTGSSKQAVGEIAAQIRRVRPPEPYKGKGIMYAGEQIRRKAGKTAKAGAV